MRDWILAFSAKYNHPVLIGYHQKHELKLPDETHDAKFVVFQCTAAQLPFPLYVMTSNWNMMFLSEFGDWNEREPHVTVYDASVLMGEKE